MMPEVMKVLEAFYPVNQSGGRIIQTSKGILHQSKPNTLPIFMDGETKLTLDEDDLYAVYTHLFTNKHLAKDIVLEAQVSIADWQKLQWKREPREIMAEDKTVVGRIGVAYKEKRRGNSLLALILISEDGSWTTITCWTENNTSEQEVAAGDIRCYLKEMEIELGKIAPPQ